MLKWRSDCYFFQLAKFNMARLRLTHLAMLITFNPLKLFKTNSFKFIFLPFTKAFNLAVLIFCFPMCYPILWGLPRSYRRLMCARAPSSCNFSYCQLSICPHLLSINRKVVFMIHFTFCLLIPLPKVHWLNQALVTFLCKARPGWLSGTRPQIFSK